MARVHNNIIIRGLTGSIGDQLVIKKTKYGQTIIANKPTFDDDREFSEDQIEHQDDFKNAARYAKGAKTNPVYVEIAKGTGRSGYNMAVADWFIGPIILEFDRTGWNGETGQLLRIKAKDNIMVTGVSLEFRDPSGELLEQGEAVQSDMDYNWWIYTMKTDIPMGPTPTVTATARDLAGNTDSMNLEL